MNTRVGVILRIPKRFNQLAMQYRTSIRGILQISPSHHIEQNNLLCFVLKFHNPNTETADSAPENFEVMFKQAEYRFYCLGESGATSVTLVYEPVTLLEESSWTFFVESLDKTLPTIAHQTPLPLFYPI